MQLLTDTGDPIVTTMAIGWYTYHGDQNRKKTMTNKDMDLLYS